MTVHDDRPVGSPSWHPHLSGPQLERNFEEIRPSLSEQAALVEAQRCFYCEYDVACVRGCPTQIDIPLFIKQIANGKPEDAARTILASNVFGAVCARVCPVEKLCEQNCICNTLHEKPIAIGKLQRFATDKLLASGQIPFQRGEPSGRQIAIVGAGPAGVSAAFELSRLGHSVVLHEREKEAGGLNRYGIAEYKIGSVFVQKELAFLLSLGGVEVRLSSNPIDEKVLEKLIESNDAVLLGIGLGPTRRLNIPGEDLPGVMDALSFIRVIKTRPLNEVAVGDIVVVVGAGNTAIDAATQAKRLGAKQVTIIYRKDLSSVKCTDHEYALSIADGCKWLWNTEPLEAFGNNEGLTSLCILDHGEQREIPCDQLIVAIGQEPNEWLGRIAGLKRQKNGTVEVDPITWMTTVPKLFAAGDCVDRAKEVVNAVYEGKRAAQSIDGFLSQLPPQSTPGP